MGKTPAIAVALGLMASAAAASAEERLVLEPYPGGPWYDVVNQSGPGGFLRERMPQGQTPQNPHDILTAQSRKGYRGSPSGYISLAFSQLKDACETVETVGPTLTEEAGRQVAYGRFYCGKQKGQPFGAHIFFKAILGSEGLYIIDRDFRIPPSEHPSAPTLPEDQAVAFLQTEGEARKYLTDKVYVCDPVFPEPRCSSEAVPTGK